MHDDIFTDMIHLLGLNMILVGAALITWGIYKYFKHKGGHNEMT